MDFLERVGIIVDRMGKNSDLLKYYRDKYKHLEVARTDKGRVVLEAITMKMDTLNPGSIEARARRGLEKIKNFI